MYILLPRCKGSVNLAYMQVCAWFGGLKTDIKYMFLKKNSQNICVFEKIVVILQPLKYGYTLSVGVSAPAWWA